MVAHRIPYTATANIAYPNDMIRKFKKASQLKGGSRFIHVFTTCPPGWQVPSDLTIKTARLAVQTNIFPLYEVENGINYTLNERGNRKVRDYLDIQGRFRHLTDMDIEQIQNMVDEDWELLVRKAGSSK